MRMGMSLFWKGKSQVPFRIPPLENGNRLNPSVRRLVERPIPRFPSFTISATIPSGGRN